MSEDTIDKSGYNEASYKMMRLHESQRRISYVNQDLIKYYHEFSGYGYIVKKTEIENLMQEVWGKLDTANKDKVSDLRKLMNNFIEEFPVFKMVRINNVEGERKVNKMMETNFKKLRDLLFEVHLYVSELLEEAGYSTFTMDVDDGDPYN